MDEFRHIYIDVPIFVRKRRHTNPVNLPTSFPGFLQGLICIGQKFIQWRNVCRRCLHNAYSVAQAMFVLALGSRQTVLILSEIQIRRNINISSFWQYDVVESPPSNHISAISSFWANTQPVSHEMLFRTCPTNCYRIVGERESPNRDKHKLPRIPKTQWCCSGWNMETFLLEGINSRKKVVCIT